MRLLSLDLERYGPFTGRRLAFRADAHLHVVLGANEAGKSCALAAVTDLLFGTKETRYEFLHREAGLRLGAQIEARDGRTLAFVRRRGGRNTLADADGKALADDALAPFLGGLTRAVFRNAFGLDAPSLREGAEEMLKSDGEIGATLFAAASGLRGFRDAADKLEEEAARLFTPAARKRRLNDLIRTYEEARSQARAERVGTEALRAVESGLTEAEERLRAIAARRKEIAGEASRLRRLKAAAPILAILDDLAARFAEFADLPEIDGETAAELARSVQVLGTAKERLSEAEAALARAEGKLAGVPADDAVRVWDEAIEALGPQNGAYRKAERDLPGVQAEADRFERDLAAVAIRLGLSDADDIRGRQPSDAARADLRLLVTSGREIEAEHLRQSRERDRLRDELARLRKARSEGAALVDPGPLRLAHEAIRPILAEIARRDGLRSEIARRSSEIEREAARLRPAFEVPADRAAPDLPSVEAITRRGEGIANAARRRDAVRERIEEVEAEVLATSGRMRSRQDLGEIPDRDALLAIRRERDVAWAQMRAAAFGDVDAPRGAELLGRASAFERAGAAADAMADRLVADAQRVADQTADARRVEDLGGERERAAARLAEAERVLIETEDGWRALWAPLAIAPLSPAEMMEWRSRVSDLLAKADALLTLRVEAGTLDERIEGIRPQLEALAERLGLASLKKLDPGLLGDRVAERLRSVTETWEAARDGAVRIASAEEQVGAAEAALLALAGRREEWQGRFRGALSACSLLPGSTLDGASAALEAWAEVPGLIRERDDRRRRVTGMRRDMETHEAEVRRLALALDLPPGRPLAEAVRTLTERVRAAREAAVERAALVRNLDEAARARDEAEAAVGRAEAALALITERLSLPAEGDLSGFVSRLGQRADLAGRLRTARDELARAGEGTPEAELRAGLAAAHVDEIEGRLADLASESERLDHDGRVAYSDRERGLAERARMEGGIGSEAATARKNAAETEIRETARRYVVLKLGSLLLDAAIERHRAGQQDPLIARAAALFAGLTGGAYAGLDQTFDDRDQPILAGRRADGRLPVAVADTSEGTRDQLFLALRLAYLEDYAGRAEPAPFLGDDIFASFDDRRTGHGLAALAAIGTRVQPILFTHHESVARAAESCLGARADVIALG